PVIAVGLVLSAVFVPCAFISGITGQFFRQFALTIAVSTIISTFNSLTLSPALAALLLRPRQKGRYETMPRLAFVLVGAWLGWEALTAWLPDVRSAVGDWAPWAALLVGAELGSFALDAGLPKGFIPAQDLGYLLINVQLPDAASDERTQAVMAKVEKIAAATPGVKNTVTISGQSFVLSAFGSNFGSMFL